MNDFIDKHKNWQHVEKWQDVMKKYTRYVDACTQHRKVYMTCTEVSTLNGVHFSQVVSVDREKGPQQCAYCRHAHNFANKATQSLPEISPTIKQAPCLSSCSNNAGAGTSASVGFSQLQKQVFRGRFQGLGFQRQIGNAIVTLDGWNGRGDNCPGLSGRGV